VNTLDPPANSPSVAPLTTRQAQTAPVALTSAVIGVRIALVLGTCVLIAVLPYVYTGADTKIVSYTAPKETPRQMPAPPSTEGKPGRLWGAIVPQKSELWFFKATGPIDVMTQYEPELRTFLESIQFDQGEPKWTLPAGWKQEPGFDFVFATIRIPAEKEPLELSVSRLVRRDSPPLDEQLLENINRWRGQATLPPITAAELATSTERLTVSEAEATLLSVAGILKPRSMGRGPFSGGK